MINTLHMKRGSRVTKIFCSRGEMDITTVFGTVIVG